MDKSYPAFPSEQFTGMTLRDYFAGQALAGMQPSQLTCSDEKLALKAYTYADAMLVARGDD